KSAAKSYEIPTKEIPFTQEVVEQVYEQLTDKQKYFIDNLGKVFRKDPRLIVREQLEKFNYKLHPAWYSWGGEASIEIDEVSFHSKRNELIDKLKAHLITELNLPRISDKMLSAFLFKNKRNPQNYLENTFRDKRGLNTRPYLSTLFGMIYCIRTMDIHDIQNEYNIDKISAEILQDDLEEIIVEFIFTNPYGSNYIFDNHPLGSTYFEPEFDLTLEVWYFLSQQKGAPISFSDMQDMVEISNFGNLKFMYSLKTIKTIWQNLYPLLDHQKAMDLEAYLGKYMSRRGLTAKSTSKRVRDKYNALFYEEWLRGFYVLRHIDKFLGFDILFFKVLDDNIFNKKRSKKDPGYRLHHLNLDLPPEIRKLSIDPNDIVVTDSTNHPTYETLTESQTRQLIKAWEELIRLGMKKGEITRRNIETIFASVEINGEPVYRALDWDFGKLNELNDFMNFKKLFNTDDFIKQWDEAYDRWRWDATIFEFQDQLYWSQEAIDLYIYKKIIENQE
ncbi:MAG: hypothetical protein ACOC44_20160, partial [Promethearchaeia archaeon]